MRKWHHAGNYLSLGFQSPRISTQSFLWPSLSCFSWVFMNDAPLPADLASLASRPTYPQEGLDLSVLLNARMPQIPHVRDGIGHLVHNPAPPSVRQLPEHPEQNPGALPAPSSPLAQATIIFHFQTVAICAPPSPCSVLQPCDLSKTEAWSCPLIYLKPLSGSCFKIST